MKKTHIEKKCIVIVALVCTMLAAGCGSSDKNNTETVAKTETVVNNMEESPKTNSKEGASAEERTEVDAALVETIKDNEDSSGTEESSENTLQLETEEDAPEGEYDGPDIKLVNVERPLDLSQYQRKAESDRKVSLTVLSKESTTVAELDWPWLESKGVEPILLGQYVGDYQIYGYGDRYGYDYTDLCVVKNNVYIADYDFSEWARPEKSTEPEPDITREYIHYAEVNDDILYASIGHNSYSESAPDTGYIVAVNMTDGSINWISEKQVSNAKNFLISGDMIICGYGFTDEPDYIFALDKKTGAAIGNIKADNQAFYFAEKDGKIYCETYNKGYVLELK